jgi:hypothetical protein
MFIIENYSTAVIFCIITMLCGYVVQHYCVRKAETAISYGLGQRATVVAAK